MKKVSDLLPPVDENQPPHGLTLEKVYRSYKNSPHNPDATYGKYLVHRLENADKYNAATPEQQETMDRKFLSLHQRGDAATKNGYITTQHLKNFITSKDTQKLAGQMLGHKQSLKNMILKEHPEHIVNINGQPHVRLTRALSVDRNQRGADHALASYADTPKPDFGDYKHHQLVPLNNIWYSYDYGPETATSSGPGGYGNEDEFLVSPHKVVYNEYPAEEPTQPIAYRNWHSHKRRTNKTFLEFLKKQHTKYNPDIGDNFYASAPDGMLLHAIKNSSNDPKLNLIIAGRIAGLKQKQISENVQQALLDTKHDDVLYGLSEHPHLAPSLQDKIYNSGNSAAIAGLAKRKDLQPHLQEKMANELQHPAVYNHLAGRDDLLPHLQEKLFQRAFNGYLTIHRHLAGKRNLQPHLQEKLLDTDDPQIDNILAERDDLLPHLQERLLNTDSPAVNRRLAKRLDLLPHVQDKLLNTNDKQTLSNFLQERWSRSLEYNLEQHHINKIAENHPELAAGYLAKKLTPQQIDHFVQNHPKLSIQELRSWLAPKHIDYFVQNHPELAVTDLSEELKPKHIDHFVQNHPKLAAEHFNDKLKPKHIDHLARQDSPYVDMLLEKHPYYRKKYLKKSEESQLIRSWLAKNIPQLTSNSGEFDSLLSKATRPQDFKSIVRALDKEGSNYVDHKPHLEEHPPEHSDLVSNYRNEVIGSPNVYKRTRLSKKGEKGGITKKVIFATKDTKPQPESFGNFVPESKWMVKPYNERVINRVKNWQRFPIQGWAEMAHQALYHAAGIGDLHQKAHVSEHNMGDMNKNEPALVIHMENGYEPISEYSDFMDVPEEHEHKALKIGLMDFLTNNLDRHHGNLLIKASDAWQPAEQEYNTPLIGDNDNGNLLNEFAQQFQNDSDFDDIKVQNPEPRKSIFTPPKVEDIKAIDHSRSFQYINNHDLKWEGRRVVKNKVRSAEGLQDFFRHYIWGSGTSIADVAPQRPKNYDQQLNFLEKHGQPLFSWWGEVGPKVRETMYKHLNYVKNPEVRAHIKRNFDARADWLDERAKFGVENFGVDWYSDPVSQYHPNQKTDEELEQERIAEARAKWAQENK